MLAALNQTASSLLRKPVLRPFLAPAVFDFWARELAPGAALDRCLARVVERRVEAKDAVTLILQPNAHFRGFAPGQHANVTVEVEGVRLTRSYSFTGIPRKDGRISITVKRAANGKVSNWLCTRTREGDVLELGPAYGAAMTLPDTLPRKLLLLAGGSGITPLMSLVRALAARGMPVEATLVYWARTRAELCFMLELQALAARHATFRVVFALEEESTLIGGELRGRPGVEQLRKIAPDINERTVYSCGPAGFVQALQTLCASAAAFHAEAFTAPVARAPATGTVRVQLTASQRVLEVPAGQPLLAALEAQGIHPPSGCRMGICNTCVCRKSSGATLNVNSGVVSSEIDDALRICISAAHSDLTLDL